jgi:hypothetical protein
MVTRPRGFLIAPTVCSRRFCNHSAGKCKVGILAETRGFILLSILEAGCRTPPCGASKAFTAISLPICCQKVPICCQMLPILDVLVQVYALPCIERERYQMLYSCGFVGFLRRATLTGFEPIIPCVYDCAKTALSFREHATKRLSSRLRYLQELRRYSQLSCPKVSENYAPR